MNAHMEQVGLQARCRRHVHAAWLKLFCLPDRHQRQPCAMVKAPDQRAHARVHVHYAYMCVHAYVWLYIHIHVRLVYMYACVCARAHVFMWECVYVCAQMHAQ